MRKFYIFLSLVLLIVGCANKPNEFDYSKSDHSLIMALVVRGSDVNKQHWVSYFIDCETKQQVINILAQAVPLGFEDEYVSFSEKAKSWSSTLSMSMKLNRNDIARNRALILPLIPKGQCFPLGFGSTVVK